MRLQLSQLLFVFFIINEDEEAAVAYMESEITTRSQYTDLNQPESIHLTGLTGSAQALKHHTNYEWSNQNQLSKVTSPAGEFVYHYHEKNPALLTKIEAPAHEVHYTVSD